MSQATLRNSDGNPFLYLEGATGSTAFGVDTTNSDQVNLVTSDAVQNVDPTSANPAIAVQSTTPGDIKFSPKGIGQSTFVNGNVEILANAGSDGNLLMQNTAAAGVSGVIEYGGDRFIHNYGTQNTFIGQLSGNFGLTIGLANALTAVGNAAMDNITTGTANTTVGANSCGATTGFRNTSIGYLALRDIAGGTSNTAVGWSSLLQTTGSNNTAIGDSAGNALTGTDSSNILVKNTGTVGDNNTIRIGTQGAGAGQQNKCFIAGINGTSVTAAGTVVINSSGQLGTTSGAPTVWNDVTGTSASMAVNNGYVADNTGLVTLTLPATAAFGSRIEVVGKGSGGWLIAQNAGQTIHFESLNTTTGVGGSLASTVRYDCVELVCVTANTDFVVKSSVGNITIV